MDTNLPRLYVIPMTSILGKLSVVQAGNTGTIPYSMRGGDIFPVRAKAVKNEQKDSEKFIDVLPMYFQCICDVLTLYFVCI